MAEESLSSFEVLFWRNVLSLAILAPWVLWHWPHSHAPGPSRPHGDCGAWPWWRRCVCYYHAVSVLPLAEAVLLNFSAPIFVPVLGFLLFRFALDGRVLAAVLIGFAGVALILKPGTEFFQPAALIGAASGVLGALSAVAIWKMPTEENPIRIAVYFALIGILATLAPVLMSPTVPPAEAWPGLVMLGVFSTAAHVLFAKGSLIAPADRGRHLHLHLGAVRRRVRLAVLGRGRGLAMDGGRRGADRRSRRDRDPRRQTGPETGGVERESQA